MSHMLHVTCYTCYMSQIKLQRILPNTPCVIYFWKAHAKSSSMVMTNTSHVTYVTCHMSHMLHDPVCYIFLEIACKIQFNGHYKYVTCHICYMLHVTHVTCHKYQVAKKFTKDPVCYIFLESSYKIQFNGHDFLVKSSSIIMTPGIMIPIRKVRIIRNVIQVQECS